MALSRRNLSTGLLLWFVTCVIMPAQVEPPAARQLLFSVFAAEPVGRLCYVAKPGTAPERLEFYPTVRSPLYLYEGPSRVQFLDVDTAAIRAEFTVPPRIRRVLLILAHDNAARTGPIQYRVLILDDSAQRHDTGTIRILNLSGLELSGTINLRSVTLQGGADEIVQVGNTAVIHLRTPYHNRTYQAYAETLSIEHSGSAFLLLLPPYRPGSLEVQSRFLAEAPVARPQSR